MFRSGPIAISAGLDIASGWLRYFKDQALKNVSRFNKIFTFTFPDLAMFRLGPIAISAGLDIASGWLRYFKDQALKHVSRFKENFYLRFS